MWPRKTAWRFVMHKFTTQIDRGQMEVLGFVFIFGIVIAAIAIIAVTGFGGLNDVRDTEKASNAVRVFEILDDNIDDIIRGQAPYRATEVSLSASQLTFGDPVEIRVSGVRVDDPSTNFSYNETTRPIEYMVTDDTTLVYVAGAVIRDDAGDAVMLEEPLLILNDEAVNLPIVETRPSWRQSNVGGTRSVNVRTQLAGTETLVADPNPYTIDISVDSRHPAVWDRYFRSLDTGSVTWDQSTDTVTLTFETDRVYINALKLDVQFE